MSTQCSQSPEHFTSLETYNKNLNHLVLMAKTPGWKEHAWMRAKQLDADTSGLFKGIKEDLVKEMK